MYLILINQEKNLGRSVTTSEVFIQTHVKPDDRNTFLSPRAAETMVLNYIYLRFLNQFQCKNFEYLFFECLGEI
jgi:hypothetical protein